MNTMTQQEIVAIVTDYLNPNQPADYQLSVFEPGIRQDDNWCYVTVIPSRDDIRAYDHAHVLTVVEDQIQGEKEMNVLLVPTLVED